MPIPNRIKRASAVFLIGMTVGLAACGESSSSGSATTPPPTPPPPDVPLGIQVVAGDGNNSDLQNTISWTLDPAVTDYSVYWSNTPGVTASSNVLVPSAQGTRYAIHSDVDVVAGTTYYYRVEAMSAGGASALSAEVQGTPQQSITNSSLNDVAWNGVDTLVAVGDSGTILSSPNGLADGWSDVSTMDAPQSLSAVTWESVNSQFVIVGAGSTVLTGDGTTWFLEDLSNFQGALNLEDISWLRQCKRYPDHTARRVGLVRSRCDRHRQGLVRGGQQPRNLPSRPGIGIGLERFRH